MSSLLAAPLAPVISYAGAGVHYGDANCSGDVDSVDAALILQYTAGLLGSMTCSSNADANADGVANSLDAALVLQFGAGLLDHLGPGTQPATPKIAPATPTSPAPTPLPSCHPSYVGVCLDPSASDYDCQGGGGNGPLYVAGPFQVVGPDKFGLDADDDGIGCE